MLTSLLGALAVAIGAALGALVSPVGSVIGGSVVALAAFDVARRRLRARSERPLTDTPRLGDAATSGASTTHDAEALALVARVSDALLVLDDAQTVVLANPAASLMFAPDGGVVVGQSLLRAAWSSDLARVVAAATGVPQELSLSGGRTLLATAYALPGSGRRTGLILTEISAARRADRSRSELVANLSHELRTPIAAARALAETLESGVDDEPRRERYQRQLLAELDRLTAIVERTLHLSRIEAGAEALEIERYEVAVLIRAALQRVAPLAEASNLELRVIEEPGLPLVLADFDRLTEVLTILLDNAVKFSSAGDEVAVRAFAGADDAARFVTFEVRDHGPGVLPSERERVFERLYTGDPARATKAGDRPGFGLGLAIARHIIARHGGRIWIEDDAGPGAAFRFTLPAAPSATS